MIGLILLGATALTMLSGRHRPPGIPSLVLTWVLFAALISLCLTGIGAI